MSVRKETCNLCDSSLIDGPNVIRSATVDDITVEIKNIPTKICPKGCVGFYWYHLDFGVQIFDILNPKNDKVAKRKFLIFIDKHYCRNCKIELEKTYEKNKFKFLETLNDGNDIELILECYSLICRNCGLSYLPAQLSEFDPFYLELSNVINLAITKDLIYD